MLSASTADALAVRDSKARERQLHPLTCVEHADAPVSTCLAPSVSAVTMPSAHGAQVLAASRCPVTDGTSRRFRLPRFRLKLKLDRLNLAT